MGVFKTGTIEVEYNGVKLTLDAKLIKLEPGQIFTVRVPKEGLDYEMYEPLQKALEYMASEEDLGSGMLVINDNIDLETFDEEMMAQYGWVRSRLPRTLTEVRDALEVLTTKGAKEKKEQA